MVKVGNQNDFLVFLHIHVNYINDISDNLFHAHDSIHFHQSIYIFRKSRRDSVHWIMGFLLESLPPRPDMVKVGKQNDF